MVETRVDELREHLDAVSDPSGVLASFLEHSPVPLALYNPAGFCVRVNPAYVELFGDEPPRDRELAEDEVLGRSGVLFWVRRAFGGEAITTPSFWYEHPELPAPDARRRIALSARAFPLRDLHGEIEFVAITFRDETDSLLLSERRRVEAEEPSRLIDEIQRADLERRTNEEQFRAVFEQCEDGVMITDDLGRVLDINPSGCRIFGARIQDIVGSRYWDHIGDVSDSRANSEKLLADGHLTAEVRVWRADGALRDLELRAVANFLPHRHLTTFLDVTERNEALRALQRSEAHLIASQRIAHVGSWEYEVVSLDDLDANVLHCSDECYRIFGLEPGSVQITPARSISFVHPDDRAGLISALRKAISTGTVYSNEHRIVRPDGTEVVVHARGEIELDPDTGRVVRLVGTTQDVTERSRVREQIQRMNEELEARVAERTSELEAANRDLEAFAYSVSHDLRAPLRAINGYAEILREEAKSDLTEMSRTALERIAWSVRRMDSLIDGLLALSRLGRRATDVRPVATRPIVLEALEECGLQPGLADGVEVVLGSLPACRADRALLRQVFVNLIGNAKKFSREKSPARIEVGCDTARGEATWYVRDNGIGFDMRHAPKVFDVFQRLTTTEVYEGTGIGLAIVDRIVRRHGGRIWTESAPDRGATFWFTLQ